MGNWTLGRQISGGFAVIVLIVMIMVGVAYNALRTAVDNGDRLFERHGRNLIDAERLKASVEREVAYGRGYLLTREEAFIEQRREANDAFQLTLTEIEARGLTPETEALLDAIVDSKTAHREATDAIIEQRRSQSDVTVIAERFETDAVPLFVTLSENVNRFIAESEAQLADERGRNAAEADNAITMLLIVGAVGSALAIAIALLLTRSLSQQLGSSVQRIRSSSAELQATATQQASVAKEQATAMSEIATTIAELLTASKQIADSGKYVATLATDSAQSATSGGEAVNSALVAIHGIKQQVDIIVQHMLDLGAKSQRIGSILEILDELAEQTNILAINATIEAAGAGEAGRRFAVVGEEVRKLADRVGASSKDIRALIDETRASVNATIMATEAGSKTVETSAERFSELQRAFEEIGTSVQSTQEAGREIELSTKQQTTAVEQVNVAISNIAQGTQETEVSTQQTLQTAAELTGLSDQLSQLVTAHRA